MIYLGADHGGFVLKENIKQFLKEHDLKYEDLGNTILDMDDDYPDYAFAVGERVGKEDAPSKKWKDRAKGILFCRSSGGMVIAANKVKNIRAVAVYDEKGARHAREHNDANIIALSGDWISDEAAKKNHYGVAYNRVQQRKETYKKT